MPYQLTVQPAFARIVYSGSVTSQELQAAATEVAAIEVASSVTLHWLSDFTQITALNLDFSAVHNLAVRMRTRRLTTSIRSALVADRPVTFGFARMFQTLNDHPQIDLRIFTSATDAEAWLTSE